MNIYIKHDSDENIDQKEKYTQAVNIARIK